MAHTDTFKVIIAGGGMAGLTLANMLEKFDIDYVLLESHSAIAPAVGASIGMFPNGMRILDQIGCYQAVEDIFSGNIPYNTQKTRDENGDVVGGIDDLPGKLEERYVRSCDRPMRVLPLLSIEGTDISCFSSTARRCWRSYTTTSSIKIKSCLTSVYLPWI